MTITFVQLHLTVSVNIVIIIAPKFYLASFVFYCLENGTLEKKIIGVEFNHFHTRHPEKAVLFH